MMPRDCIATNIRCRERNEKGKEVTTTAALCWVEVSYRPWLLRAPGHCVPACPRDRQDFREGRFRIPRSRSEIAVLLRTRVRQRSGLRHNLRVATGGPSERFVARRQYRRSRAVR